MKTDDVLVRGAFADSSSWEGVIPELSGLGHRVIAAQHTVEIATASHVVGISHPDDIVQMITQAAVARTSVDA